MMTTTEREQVTLYDAMDLVALVTEVERIARAERDFDGHITLMRFTGGWKAAFGTPGFFIGTAGAHQVGQLPNHTTLRAALATLANDQPSFDEIEVDEVIEFQYTTPRSKREGWGYFVVGIYHPFTETYEIDSITGDYDHTMTLEEERLHAPQILQWMRCIHSNPKHQFVEE
jgi:hypothetical protein